MTDEATKLLRELIQSSDRCDALRDENLWSELEEEEKRESLAWKSVRAYLSQAPAAGRREHLIALSVVRLIRTRTIPAGLPNISIPTARGNVRNSRPVFPYPPGLPSFPSLELQSQVEKDYAREIEKFQRELEAWRNLPSPSRHVESAAPSAAPAPAAFTGCTTCVTAFLLTIRNARTRLIRRTP